MFTQQAQPFRTTDLSHRIWTQLTLNSDNYTAIRTSGSIEFFCGLVVEGAWQESLRVGKPSAMLEEACRDIPLESVQGRIQHARGYFPRCLARANIACDVRMAFSWPHIARALKLRKIIWCEWIFTVWFTVLKLLIGVFSHLQHVFTRHQFGVLYSHEMKLLKSECWVLSCLCGLCWFFDLVYYSNMFLDMFLAEFISVTGQICSFIQMKKVCTRRMFDLLCKRFVQISEWFCLHHFWESSA